MKDNLKLLLDKIYELEGLVHLCLKRDDETDHLLRLIESKGKEVDSLCRTLKSGTMQTKTPEEVSYRDYNMDEYAIDAEDDETDGENTNFSSPTGSGSRKAGRLVFTVNERYRFKRELFENSDADFNNTLALVASMENYDEAEEYFISEEGFNMGNPVVREFLEIIKRYFK